MPLDEGTLRSLFGGRELKQRVQHPKVQECKDRTAPYWFFRYRHDEILTDGSVKTTRKRHICGPSKGPQAINRKQAEIVRDDFLHGLNAAPTRVEAAVAAQAPQPTDDPGQIIFGKLAELWRTEYVEKLAAGRPLIATPTREKYIRALENHILPKWKDAKISDLKARHVLAWLQEESNSWHMMADLRGVMSGIITKAMEWEIFPETFANPIHRVKLPKKWEVREKRILTEEQTAVVLARINEAGNLLICETCLDTGTRISEVTGLMIKHVDLEKGTILIAQRNWRGDIDVPKTEKSKRTLALGGLVGRYRDWIAKLPNKGPDAFVFPNEADQTQPRWDSGVRQALKRAARAVKPEGADETDLGLDFPGFGPHSLRRANITWRQEVGGSAIEASKIAGHANTKITQEYTIVQLRRQEELTRRIQDKRAKAAKRSLHVVKKETAA
jgi:integrase